MGKKIALGCGGLIVLFIVIGVIASMNSNKSGTTSQPSQSGQTQEKKSVYAVGETINLNNHQLIVNTVTAPWTSGNQFSTPQSSDNEFVLVNVTVINSGKSQLSVNPFGFKLEDDAGVQRDMSIAVVDNQLGSTQLSSGGKVSGNIVFEAKKGSASLKLHYSPGFLGGDEVTVNLK